VTVRALAVRLRPMLGPLWPLARRLARRLGVHPSVPPPSAPPPAPVLQGAAGPCVAGIELHLCTVFQSYLLVRGVLTLAPGAVQAALEVEVTQDGARPPQLWRVVESHGGGLLEFAAEVLVGRTAPPAGALLRFRSGDHESAWHLRDLLLTAQVRDLRSLMPRFQQMVADRAAAGERPAMLDIGGRARSGVQRSELFPDCDVTVLDIVAEPGVDVVGDAHEMSRLFPAESFDFAMSISVFEHLLMPWKVAIELNRVLKPGGVALIHTHQTEGMHDRPWDFLRFSDTAWAGIFNRYTGFEVICTDLSRYMHAVPAVLLEGVDGPECGGGFQCSGVMVRKTGPALVEWAVPLADVVKTSYPQGADAQPV
jgi:SAM-dependent methyltransferase